MRTFTYKYLLYFNNIVTILTQINDVSKQRSGKETKELSNGIVEYSLQVDLSNPVEK